MFFQQKMKAILPTDVANKIHKKAYSKADARETLRGLTGVELLETKQILLDAIFMRSRPNMRSFFSIKIWEFLQKAQTFTILRYSYRKASHFPLCHTQNVTQLMKIFANFNLIFVAICCIIELHLIPLHYFQQFVVLFLKFGFEV